MDDLDSYLTGPFQKQRKDIEDVDALLGEVCSTFIHAFDAESAWPYETRSTGGRAPDSISHSTTAMILVALRALLGDGVSPSSSIPDPRAEVPSVELDKQVRKELSDRVQKAAGKLLDSMLKKHKGNTSSGTYGINDPFTAYWLGLLAHLDWDSSGQKTKWETIEKELKDRANKWSENKNNNHEDYFQYEDEKTENRPQKNAFIILRAVQFIRRFRHDTDLLSAQQYFETNLHDQLSFSSIPDSRFDPAELAFCLEGMLITEKGSVDPTLFQRVSEVLRKAQEENAYWRPVKPVLSTQRGLVLFPVSVEVANSFVRSCFLMDGDDIHDTVGSGCIDLFQRYWKWLRVRKVSFHKVNGSERTKYVGWHSEHINDPSVIHPWETSQVVEFLLYYRAELYRHMARSTLTLSRFKRDLSRVREKESGWESTTKTYEPVSFLGEKYKVYQQINSEFVEPRKNDADANFSMLLYGPPGTGKTTVVENLAKELGWPLITITVSDFLAMGGAQVEARAKTIFEVLMSQTHSVVLFDEIDHFLLDRDSPRYENVETVFQFMTPGMLTKLNDLRRAGRVIFAIATNYADRIDAAIKRPGRIDSQYLVLPPDLHRRAAMMKSLFEEYGITTKFEEKDWGKLSKAALFLGYKDIESSVKKMLRAGSINVDFLHGDLSSAARTISLQNYGSVFLKKKKSEKAGIGSNTWPLEEFLCLVGLQLEVGKPGSSSTRALALAREKLLGKDCKTLDKAHVLEHASKLDENRAAEVAVALEAAHSSK